MTQHDLPAVEVLEDAEPEAGAPPPRGWTLGSWRETPARSAVAAGVLVITLILAGMQLGDRWTDPPNLLHEWAAGQHDTDPPPGIDVPEPTCDDDPRDVLAVRRCLREGHDAGRAVSGHVQYELGWPDAVDYWFEIAPDGSARIVERWVSPEPRPDVEGDGVVRDFDLRLVRTTWWVSECAGVSFFDEEDVYPGVACEDDVNDDPVPRREETSLRPVSDEEREQLVRAFACAYPDELEGVDC